MKRLISVFALISSLAAMAAPGAVSRFTAPQQPWTSDDGQIRLLRPAIARPTTSQAPLGALMASGWRLNWEGRPDTQGVVALRLILPVKPTSASGQVTEVLQIGWSAEPEALRTCLTFGLHSNQQRPLPPRTINGVTFTAVSNGDAGMSQSIDATDLRRVIGGRCYAVERFSYAVSAADSEPAITLSQKQGASMLDASLSSLLIGPGRSLPVPHLTTHTGTVAR